MFAQTFSKRLPTSQPVPPAAAPPTDEPKAFAESPELGEQLEHLQHEQATIDRRAAEELARLRELQDRD